MTGLIPQASLEGVSLVVPAYNEEHSIDESLRRFDSTLRDLSVPYEIIVVVDGTDRTAEVARTAGLPSVHVLESGRRLGKGGAIIRGFREAQYGTVGYTDADGSLGETSLKELICACRNFDCAFGSRWTDGAVWISREPWLKERAGRIFNALVRLVLGVEVKDTQCGAKFYRAKAIRVLLPKVRVTNLTTDVSFAYHAHEAGLSIVEVPVTWANRDESRFNLGVMPILMLLTLLGMKWAAVKSARKGLHPSDHFVARVVKRLGMDSQ